MQKLVNGSALILFILLLLLDAFDLPNLLLQFLVIGAIPGTPYTLSPSLMLAVLTTATAMIIFEIAARHLSGIRKARSFLLTVIDPRNTFFRRHADRI